MAWLSDIGMKAYLAHFIEQFVDGQTLLNDLSVKSLHSGKIMREVAKLKHELHQPGQSQAQAQEEQHSATSVHL